MLNEIIKYDSIFNEKIKDSLKKSSDNLKSTANKIRKDVKNAELSKRKSMIIEAEKIESESENNLLRISEIEIGLNNKRINKNEELIKDLLSLYNLEIIEELKKENKPLIDKIKELKKSMNTYYLEASNKKSYDNKSELLTMTDEAGKALIDNQKKLINQFINSLPENYNKNTSIPNNTEDIISAIKINEKEKVNILLELSEANIKEHAKQKKNIKT
ncbi:MAG: hypothetical protein ACK452_00830, partial [Bacteroidota bacterium]